MQPAGEAQERRRQLLVAGCRQEEPSWATTAVEVPDTGREGEAWEPSMPVYPQRLELVRLAHCHLDERH